MCLGFSDIELFLDFHSSFKKSVTGSNPLFHFRFPASLLLSLCTMTVVFALQLTLNIKFYFVILKGTNVITYSFFLRCNGVQAIFCDRKKKKLFYAGDSLWIVNSF